LKLKIVRKFVYFFSHNPELCLLFCKPISGLDTVFSYSSELLIKEIKGNNGDTTTIPVLVYKIVMDANISVNDEIGYVDAHTGKVVATAPKIWGATYNGTFTTRYSGTQVAKTSLSSSSYILKDDESKLIFQAIEKICDLIYTAKIPELIAI
jgi:hypothetical protein